MFVQVNRRMIVHTLGYNDDDQAALRRAENCDLIEYRWWPSKKNSSRDIGQFVMELNTSGRREVGGQKRGRGIFRLHKRLNPPGPVVFRR